MSDFCGNLYSLTYSELLEALEVCGLTLEAREGVLFIRPGSLAGSLDKEFMARHRDGLISLLEARRARHEARGYLCPAGHRIDAKGRCWRCWWRLCDTCDWDTGSCFIRICNTCAAALPPEEARPHVRYKWEKIRQYDGGRNKKPRYAWECRFYLEEPERR